MHKNNISPRENHQRVKVKNKKWKQLALLGIWSGFLVGLSFWVSTAYSEYRTIQIVNSLDNTSSGNIEKQEEQK